jgi:hypothetical protein
MTRSRWARYRWIGKSAQKYGMANFSRIDREYFIVCRTHKRKLYNFLTKLSIIKETVGW